MRLGVAEIAKVRAQFDDPLRVDSRDGAREKLRRLHDLTRDDPQRLLALVVGLRRGAVLARLFAAFVEIRSGKKRGQPVAGSLVGIALLPQRDLPEQAGEDGAVDRGVAGVRALARSRRVVFHGVGELAENVAPFAHARRGEKVRFAETAERVAAALCFRLRRRAPDIEQRQEIRIGIGERAMRGGGGFLLVLRPLARIGHAQPGGDDEHLGQRLFHARLEQHAAERRVDGQAREFVAERGEFIGVVERAEFVQELVAGADGGGDRRIDEWKRLDVAELEGLHPQDDFREIRALDFRLGETRALFKIILRVKPDARPVLHAARATGALIGAALRNVLDRQALGARARIVAAQARKPGVDHVADARQRDGSLRDIRGHDHPPTRPRREDALLLGGGHAPEKPDHLDAGAEAAFEQVAGVANVALGRHEDEHVAGFRLNQRILRRPHRGLNVREFFVGGKRLHGRVADFHGPEPPRDLDDRRTAKRFGKRRRVDGRRRDDELQVATFPQQSLEVAEEEVDVQRTLVGFIENERGVGAEQGIGLDLGEQNAVGHELDPRVAPGVVVEAHLAADLAAPRHTQLLGDAPRHTERRDPPRLGAADFPALGQSRIEAHFRELRRLSRPRLSCDDDHLTRPQRRDDLRAPGADREVFRVEDGGHAW